MTALQLAMLAVLKSWGVTAQAVVGHSSGEIAAACAAGYLDEANAIKAAFYRGQAAIASSETNDGEAIGVGMLAAGLGPEEVKPYMAEVKTEVQIACYNKIGRAHV